MARLVSSDVRISKRLYQLRLTNYGQLRQPDIPIVPGIHHGNARSDLGKK